ncbi:MAG TPA: IPT/TIG domain-containing protein, partial [Candidatus Nanopelagicaceae bacterium]
MKHSLASRFRIVLPLAVTLSLLVSLFAFAPSAFASNPVIQSVNPMAVPTNAYTQIVITGTGFLLPDPVVTVEIAGSPVSYQPIVSDTQIIATAPPHVAGFVDVYVYGGAHTSTLPNFQYVDPGVTFNVTYDGNCSGTCGTVPTDGGNPHAANSTVNVLGAPSLNKPGYTFGGWSLGGMGVPTPISSFVITADTTLFAVWNLVTTFSVTYDGNCSNTCGSVPGTSAY